MASAPRCSYMRLKAEHLGQTGKDNSSGPNQHSVMPGYDNYKNMS